MALKRIVNLHAVWCAPCRKFEETFNIVANDESLNKDIKFERYDIESDEGTELTEKYSVKAVPTTLLLDENDECLVKLTGSMLESDFRSAIEKNLNQENKE